MKRQGWKVSASSDSIQGSYDPSQQSVYLEALDKCEAGKFPDPTAYSISDQKGAYAAAAKTYDCLAALGEPVGDKISFQTFVDQGSRWNPYSAINRTQPLTNSKLDQLEKSCPQPEYWPRE